MGMPPKVMVNGEAVFLCCEGCRERLLKDPETHLQKLREFRENGELRSSDSDGEFALPPIGEMQTDFEMDSIPDIREIEILSPALLELEPRQSAAQDAEIRRIQQ